MGFLGGIAFTGLVLVLTMPDNFQPAIFGKYAVIWFYALIWILAGTCAVCVFASFGFMQLAGGLVLQGGMVEWISVIFSSLGLLGFVFALPMLIFAFTPTGAGLLFVVELIFVAILGIVVPRDRKKLRNALTQSQKSRTQSEEP